MKDKVEQGETETYRAICKTCFVSEEVNEPVDKYSCGYCKTHDMNDLKTRLERRIDVLPRAVVFGIPKMIKDMYDYFSKNK